MNTLFKKAALSLITAAVLSSCGTAQIKEVKSNVVKDMEASEAKYKQANANLKPFKKIESLQSLDGVWVGAKRVALNNGRGVDLPAKFSDKFSLTSANQLTLQEISEQVNLEKGIPVIISSDSLLAIKDSRMRVNYSGSLAGFLDSVTSRFGLNWKYEKGSIRIARLETRSWIIRTSPGMSKQDASVTTATSSSGSSNAGGGSSGSSPMSAPGGAGAPSSSTISGGGSTSAESSTSGAGSQSASTTAKITIWDDIDKTVASMLTKEGKFYDAQSTSTLTVTDTSLTLDKVDEFVKNQNLQMTRQVLVNVKAYSVTLTDEHQSGVDWSILYNTAKGAVTIAQPYLGAGIAASSIGAKLINPSSQFSGSEVVLRALQSQGDVSLITSTAVTTLNNQPVPVQVGNQTGYLQSVATVLSTTGTSQTSLTPGTLSTGFNLNLLPALFADGKMVLQYSISITDLAGLKSITSGTSTIQLPEINTRNFMQRVSIRSGQTLVLSGFERMTNTVSKGGIDYDSPILGHAESKKSRDIVVIEITPVIVEDDQ